MSTAKHTRGEWIADGPYIKAANRELIAQAYRMAGEHDREVAEANARLIAAAPDLLAALVALEEGARAVQAGEWEKDSIQIERMKAQDAIAKATGTDTKEPT